MAWCAIAMPPPRHRPTGPLTPPQPKRLGADSDHRRAEVQQHKVALQPRLGPDMPPQRRRPVPPDRWRCPRYELNRRTGDRLQPQRPRIHQRHPNLQRPRGRPPPCRAAAEERWTVRRTEIDLNGATATIGQSDTVTATSDQDRAWTTAHTISCGDLTIARDGLPPADSHGYRYSRAARR
jgi:hypothetical protein